MRLSQLVLRHSVRTPLRMGITVLTVAIMLAAFILPRALIDAQEEQVRQTPNDRVVSRSKLGWSSLLPLGYVDVLGQMPGVERACGSRWAGLRLPSRPEIFFPSFGIDPESFIEMHDELQMPPEAKRAWLSDERGALVHEELAEQLGLHVGDRVVFEGSHLPGTWEVTVSAIYRSAREGFGKRTVWLHYGFFNRALPPTEQDKVGAISARITDPNQGARIAAEIDAKFADSQFETLSVEDRVLSASTIGRFRAVLDALDMVSYLILFVMTCMVSNTMALNVRERVRQYGVMRAIGFSPATLVALVLAEGAIVGLLGGLIGLGISHLLFDGLLTQVIQDVLQFPPVKVPARVALTAILSGAGLSMVSAGLPAYRLSQLELLDALRRVA